MLPGQTMERAADERPFAALVWSGEGAVNGHVLAVGGDSSEFLVTPGTALTLRNTSATADLLVFTVFPMEAP